MKKAGKMVELSDPFDTKEFAKFRLEVISEMERKLFPVYSTVFKQLAEEAVDQIKIFEELDKNRAKRGKNG